MGDGVTRKKFIFIIGVLVVVVFLVVKIKNLPVDDNLSSKKEMLIPKRHSEILETDELHESKDSKVEVKEDQLVLGDIVVTPQPTSQTPKATEKRVIPTKPLEESENNRVEVGEEDMFVNVVEGDIDEDITVADAGKIFLDDVFQLTAIYPMNRIDFIIAEISKPFIELYGEVNYVYEIKNFVTKKGFTSFQTTAKDRRNYYVIIKKMNEDFVVSVEEAKGVSE